MKKRYESPETEKMTVISENVMNVSAEETADNEANDNLHEVSRLIEKLQR